MSIYTKCVFVMSNYLLLRNAYESKHGIQNENIDFPGTDYFILNLFEFRIKHIFD